LLPELFNVGYGYDVELFKRAESVNGETTKFLTTCAKENNIMVGGSFLVKEGMDIYDRFMLFSPNGDHWQCDKKHPWGWERGYFRSGEGITIADTHLGRIGILVCWDVAHTKLWEAYKGKVDIMLVCSSPPVATKPTYYFPNGKVIKNEDLGRVAIHLSKEADPALIFKNIPKKLAKCLGVNVICSSTNGTITTEMPHPRILWLTYCILNPTLLKYWGITKKITAKFDMAANAQIIDSSGVVLVECENEQRDAWVQQKIDLTSKKDTKTEDIPKRLLSRFSYFLADTIFFNAAKKTYMKRFNSI
jgi:hypothetical protein